LKDAKKHCQFETYALYIICIYMPYERWGAGVETQKMYGERLGDGVEYHLMSPTPRR